MMRRAFSWFLCVIVGVHEYHGADADECHVCGHWQGWGS